MTAVALALILAAPPAPEPAAPDVKDNVKRGLKWLADQQKDDGRWDGFSGNYPTYVTAFAGLALLMEGSTLKHGDYAPNIRKALAWVEKNTDAEGRISNKHSSETNWDVNGHALATLFLVCAYDVDDDEERRTRLAKAIDRGVSFLTGCQIARGGWAYASGEKTFDDAYATVSVLQALFAARKSGFEVPTAATKRATEYLVKATKADGGVRYSLDRADTDGLGGTDPLLAAGAAANHLTSDGRLPDTLSRWVKNAKATASSPMQNLATNPLAIFQQYPMARVAYALGEEGHRRVEPGAKGGERVTWSAYKATAFKPIIEAQSKDGGWPEVYYGRAQTTAFALIVLQLDNEYLPAFSR